jgi:hypothetical protein
MQAQSAFSHTATFCGGDIRVGPTTNLERVDAVEAI